MKKNTYNMDESRRHRPDGSKDRRDLSEADTFAGLQNMSLL